MCNKEHIEGCVISRGSDTKDVNSEVERSTRVFQCCK